MKVPLYLISDDSKLLAYWQQALASFEPTECIDWPPERDAVILLDAQSQRHPWSALLASSQANSQRVVLASSTPDDEEAYRALQGGMSGYCHAFAPATLLVQVIEVVQAGEIWAGRSLVQRLVGAINRLPNQAHRLQGLSEREIQVAHLTAKGLSNKEIARQLEITERTVKAHLTLIFEKLQVSDRVQLVLRVNGLA
jgi:two-component system nitrate/nitrite response regulator NarL